MKRNLHAGERMSGGFGVNVFTDDELYEIHLATLEVLEKTGVCVQDEEAIQIMADVLGIEINCIKRFKNNVSF